MSIAVRLACPALREGAPQCVRGRQSGDAGMRWSLARYWESSADMQEWLPWIMLNPSTADGVANDPTLLRIIRWTWSWGFPGLIVFNVYPFRSSSPAAIAEQVCYWDERQDYWTRDAIWKNHNLIAKQLMGHDAAMVAWGAPRGKLGAETEMWAEQLFDTINDPEGPRERSIETWCLGTTKGGDPLHPMARGKHRVPDDARPIRHHSPGTITFGPLVQAEGTI